MSAAPAYAGKTATGSYHCSVKGVGRANGRSIVAAAAYRSGERLVDEITGTVADYRARSGVLDTFILAPEDAPTWAQDRGQLWNEAERAETRGNGRLATELELALPHELNAAQRKELLTDFLRPLVERYGVAVDVAIHVPGKGHDHRNIHAHVLVTHRSLTPDGFGAIPNERYETRSRKDPETKQKQRVVEKISGIAATPADIRAIRKGWEQSVNHAYERAGLDIRVDHRSHKDRGIAQEPSVHLGPQASAIERRGDESLLGKVNREITERNATVEKIASLEAEVRKVSAQIYDLNAERERRYGSLEDALREARQDQFDGRYAALRDAEPPPEKVREFEANASRSTEPATLMFDRDAADAKWFTKLEAAAIANDNVPKEEAIYDRDAADAQWHAKLEAAAIAHEKEAMREAARIAWRDSQQHWRDVNTPQTPLEAMIGEALAHTMTGVEFAEALDKAGVTIARTTSADVLALGSLRKEAQLAAIVARAEIEPNTDKNARHFGDVSEGDFAAVTRKGDVIRLNPTALDFEETEQRLADVQTRLPSIVEARALNQKIRERADAEWRQRQDYFAARNTARFEARQWQETFRNHLRTPIERAVRGGIAETAAMGGQAFDAAHTLLGGATKVFEGAIGFLGGLFGASEPKLTRQQAKDILRAQSDPEILHAREVAVAANENEAAHDWRMHVEKTAQQQQDLSLSERFGTPPTREANIGREGRSREDDYERERER